MFFCKAGTYWSHDPENLNLNFFVLPGLVNDGWQLQEVNMNGDLKRIWKEETLTNFRDLQNKTNVCVPIAEFQTKISDQLTANCSTPGSKILLLLLHIHSHSLSSHLLLHLHSHSLTSHLPLHIHSHSLSSHLPLHSYTSTATPCPLTYHYISTANPCPLTYHYTSTATPCLLTCVSSSITLSRSSFNSVRTSISLIRVVISSSSSLWVSLPRFSQNSSFLGVLSGGGVASTRCSCAHKNVSSHNVMKTCTSSVWRNIWFEIPAVWLHRLPPPGMWQCVAGWIDTDLPRETATSVISVTESLLR